MGSDKAFLTIENRHFYKTIQELLQPFCENVYVSCNEYNKHKFRDIETICDLERFNNCGPIAGILSAFFKVNESWFVVGTDYPMLIKDDLQELLNNRNPDKRATVFFNPVAQIPEPLVGIYEKTCFPELLRWIDHGNTSLLKFLKMNTVHLVKPLNFSRHASIDTPVQFEQIKK